MRGFGLKMGVVTRKGFEARVRELSAGQAMLEQITKAMLAARAALWREFEQLHREMLRIVREDEICRRMMVAYTFKSAIDDPGRIAKSKTVGALFGLVPKKYQSGERDVSSGITRTGDESVRTALYEAANVMVTRTTRFSSLKRWHLSHPDLANCVHYVLAFCLSLATISLGLYRSLGICPPSCQMKYPRSDHFNRGRIINAPAQRQQPHWNRPPAPGRSARPSS
jgi:hypothetical protein